MQIKKIIQIAPEAVDQLTGLLPFLREIKQSDEWQYNLLLQNSRVVTYSQEEVVLDAGAEDHWLCFLVKGQLDVRQGATGSHLNVVTPGEVFGDLAMVLRQRRSATVAVSSTCSEAVVFEVNFAVFGELREVHHISLQTKLAYYRSLLLGLRWKLEVYRTTYSGHELANRHRQVKLYRGEKNTLDELIHLDGQAQELAKLLILWNQHAGYLEEASAHPQVPAELEKIGY